MVSSLELRRIAAFSNLPDDQISWHRKSLFKQERPSCDRASQQTGWSFS
ncbi:MAG: hypothetical protein JWQ49_4990 [Edaphobacter sp.]|nr:hypothetical protein [Edaphobacter sp.]